MLGCNPRRFEAKQLRMVAARLMIPKSVDRTNARWLARGILNIHGTGLSEWSFWPWDTGVGYFLTSLGLQVFVHVAAFP